MENIRKRTANFTQDEKSVLMELVAKYKDLIENKKSDATTNAEKVQGWKRLTQEFNAHSTYCGRTPESLKTCWENIKRQTKKQSATRKRELFKTGGGRLPPAPGGTGADRLVEDILGPALEGLENFYDSDALLDDKENENSNTDDYTQGTEINPESIMSQVIVIESEPSGSFTEPINEITVDGWSEGTTLHNKVPSTSQPQLQVQEENDNSLKWEGWTPKTLKRPLSEVLKSRSAKENKDKSWLKRRRPDQINLSDQLIHEKIKLVKTLIQNAQEESAKRLLILDEQLKQEKIKTKKMS